MEELQNLCMSDQKKYLNSFGDRRYEKFIKSLVAFRIVPLSYLSASREEVVEYLCLNNLIFLLYV